MANELSNLKPSPGSTKPRKRVGRGEGSGKGKTAGRGTKGQGARNTIHPRFEGGQMPLQRRLPKRGFNNIFRKNYVEVNLGRLQTAIDAGKLDASKPIDAAALVAAGVITKKRDGIRVLGNGVLKTKIEIHAAGASKAAAAGVEAAGGSLVMTAPAKIQADGDA